MSNIVRSAKDEIRDSLKLCNFCNIMLGVDYYDEERSSKFYSRYFVKSYTIFVFAGLCLFNCGKLFFMYAKIAENSKLEDIIPLIHMEGYVLTATYKLYLIWMKKSALKRILTELETVWPTASSGQAEVDVKNTSYNNIVSTHTYYAGVNLTGLFMYIMTPFYQYVLQLLRGEKALFPTLWFMMYPYDRTAPGLNQLTFVWEAFIGSATIFSMIGPDLVFAAFASNIAMLLQILSLRLRSLAPEQPDCTAIENLQPQDQYDAILQLVKLHIKLLRWSEEIENLFSMFLFITIVLSSINICCAGFVAILLEPVAELGTKLHLLSILYQIGVLCWCGDYIFQMSGEVCLAAYSGGWYRCDPRCRRLLAILMLRSQKPIIFTAMKFKTVNLVTFSGILTTSYSYFTLLYTMYAE